MNKWLKINTNMEFSTTIPRPTKTNNHNRKEFVSVKKPLCFLDSINRLFHIKICGGVDLVPIFYYLSLSPLASLFLSVVRIKLKKTTTRNKKKKNKNNNNNPKRMSSLNSSGGSRGRGRSSGSERSSGRGSGSGSGSERSSGSGSERSSSSSSSSSVQSAPLINPQEDVPALTKDEEMFEKRESPRKSVDLEAPQQAPSKMGYQVDEEKGGCCKEEGYCICPGTGCCKCCCWKSDTEPNPTAAGCAAYWVIYLCSIPLSIFSLLCFATCCCFCFCCCKYFDEEYLDRKWKGLNRTAICCGSYCCCCFMPRSVIVTVRQELDDLD